MANFNAVTTIVGNLTADPELRYTPESNLAVVNARIASTPRKFNKQTNAWEDGEPVYLTVNVWRTLAENVAASLHKGDRVVVTGNLTQRSYQTKDGDERTVYEIEAAAIGPDLSFATAYVTKNNAGGGPSGPQGAPQGRPAPRPQSGGFGAPTGPQGGYAPQQGGGYSPQQPQQGQFGQDPYGGTFGNYGQPAPGAHGNYGG